MAQGMFKRGSHLGDNMERQMSFTGNQTEKSEMIDVEIDLTDPQDLLSKLEMIDLTEDETDELLQRAYQINAMLRKRLQEKKSVETHHIFSVSAPASTSLGNINQIAHVSSNLPKMNSLEGDMKESYSVARLTSASLSGHVEKDQSKSSKNPRYSYHSARAMRSMVRVQ